MQKAAWVVAVAISCCSLAAAAGAVCQAPLGREGVRAALVDWAVGLSLALLVLEPALLLAGALAARALNLIIGTACGEPADEPMADGGPRMAALSLFTRERVTVRGIELV
jgi:hypothetical protein